MTGGTRNVGVAELQKSAWIRVTNLQDTRRADLLSDLDRGEDVLWIRAEAPGISDEQVLAPAQAEDRLLITFDKDFGELAFRARLPVMTTAHDCYSAARDNLQESICP
jgi:predicted nuclease of predicted toxin-antitoxin system